MKMNITIVALVASLLTIAAARELKQSTTNGTARVTFFDNGNYSGGGQAFSTDVPATGCGGSENLVRRSLPLPYTHKPYVMSYAAESSQ